MKTLKTALLVSVFLFSFFACNSDDEGSFQIKYSSEDLVKLTGEDFKHWGIQAYYANYNQKILHDKSTCYTDDIFVFQNGSNEIMVIPGEVSCNLGEPEDEITTASYEFYEEDGLIFISISKAVSVNDVIKNTFFSLQLVELTDTQMIFASGEKGDYKVAIVFVAV
ncbi:hypothetical protein SYJ56_12185 [Algoriphagus sp. D3-2-R+10]|uniref:hypothetical protein n=1 Tax=Algoriphagus aurantiacus TaxID=3103948 RepID=UPI002B396B42|nr:hypothetical protein [Algoriphagus sp. D3-2-R+10]MEB2776072.1 hypothetical protein [Algoriphagus sp. D3-2-R+10]